jgi:hypothetical protein
VRANQVERDLPVDFAAGTAPCDLEVMWVYLAHELILFFIKTN